MTRQPTHHVELDHATLHRQLSLPRDLLLAAVLVLATGWVLWGSA